MRLVIQRASSASVTIGGRAVAEAPGRCVVVLAGIGPSDDERDIEWCASKILGLKLWADGDGKDWRRSASDLGAPVVVVSQFTLFARLNGRRPDFSRAMAGELARDLFAQLVAALRASHEPVLTGEFGEHMVVSLQNDGPVTILLDSREEGITLPPVKARPAVGAGAPARNSRRQPFGSGASPVDPVRVSIAEAPAGSPSPVVLTLSFGSDCLVPVTAQAVMRPGPAGGE